MNKKTIFVGAGSANLFAILYLLDNGYNGEDVLVIDKGKSPYKRDKSHEGLLFGFAGAGLWSDGKMVFSSHPDRINVSDNNKKLCHQRIKNITKSFMKDININMSTPKNMDVDLHGLELLQSEVWHLGTDNNVEFGKRTYDYMLSEGVKFMFDTEVMYIQPNGNYIRIQEADKEGTYVIAYENLQVGLGKTGIKLMSGLSKEFNLPMSSGAANIGGRMEIPFTEETEHIARDIQYDFKFCKTYDTIGLKMKYDIPDEFKVSIRSFCINHFSAHVIEEPIDTDQGLKMTYNGHAYGFDCKPERITNRTNFGIIMRIEGGNTQKIHNDLLYKFAPTGTVLMGDGCSWKKDIKPEVRFIDVDTFRELYDSVCGFNAGAMFFDFMERLNNILKFNNGYMLHLPEIKMAAGVLDTDEHFRIKDGRFNNISWVGDCCTGAVGITPSAVTGIMGIKRLLK